MSTEIIKKLQEIVPPLRRSKKKVYLLLSLVLIAVSILSYSFVSANAAYYQKTIARITSVSVLEESKAYDYQGNAEPIYVQLVNAKILNGEHIGERIQFQNKTSYSQAFDLNLKAGEEIFVTLTEDASGQIVSAGLKDFKRDKYIAYIAILFVLFIILIGGKKGLRSLASVIFNVAVLAAIIALDARGCNLTVISSIASILFIIASILLVNGRNNKSLSAIAGTMAGTLLSMLIAVVVIWAVKSKGIYFEEMEFLTRPAEEIFLVGILIGTLGGIMDIAVAISAAVQELYDKNPGIDRKALMKSGMEIGKDIMGTQANVLVFVYISGSIPMILLLMRNGFSFFYIMNYNLSLEIVRALTGCIGVVISIPVTLYIAVILLGSKRTGRVRT
jgi:uncharacterized membrane protein